MKINLHIIMDELSPFIEWADVREASTLVECFSMVDPDNGLSDHCLYIWDFNEQISCHPLPDTCLFLYSDYADNFPMLLNRIMLKKEISLNRLSDLLNQVFLKYNHWSDRLKESLLNEEGVKKLYQLSLPIFNNPICYINNEYRVMFLAEPENGIHLKDVYGDEMSEDQITGQSMMETIQTSKTYEETMRPGGATIWEEEHWNGRFMNVNYFEDGQGMGCILLSDCNRAFKPGDKYLLEHLAKMVIHSIKRRVWYPSKDQSSIRQILKNMIEENKLPDHYDLLNFSITCNWNMDDHFLFICIFPDAGELARKALHYHCANLEKMFPNSYAYEYSSRIIYIINLTKTHCSHSEIDKRFSGFCKKNHMHAGISRAFQNLHKLLEGCQEALIAYQTGLARHPKENIYKFEDYALSYMLNNACGKLTSWQLLPDGLHAVIEHDQKTGSSYWRVLQTWLENNCNITDSVKALYMHRNTFLYQLDKVKELLKTDLKDADNRLYLQICMRIYDIGSNS